MQLMQFDRADSETTDHVSEAVTNRTCVSGRNVRAGKEKAVEGGGESEGCVRSDG